MDLNLLNKFRSIALRRISILGGYVRDFPRLKGYFGLLGRLEWFEGSEEVLTYLTTLNQAALYPGLSLILYSYP